MVAPENRELVHGLLSAADLGVRELEVLQEPPTHVQVFLDGGGLDSLPLEVQSTARAQMERAITVVLHHDGPDGPRPLPLESESRGTIGLLSALDVILPAALQSGGLLLADDLGCGLHPHLVRELIALFSSEESNPNGAQLLFATHDVTTMSALRRDEIVFVEKDASGASSLVPLSDFDTHKRDNIVRAYKQGRFGGVPALVGFSALVGGGGSCLPRIDAAAPAGWIARSGGVGHAS